MAFGYRFYRLFSWIKTTNPLRGIFKMASDLTKGGYSGRETKLYYNSATYASPTWVEIVRARNVQKNRGKETSEIEFHGGGTKASIAGYPVFSGSFEYVRKAGTDSVYTALETHREAGTIVDLVHLNGTILLDESKGWRCPVLLGEFAETANGSDGVVVTIPFVKADAYDSGGNLIDWAAFTGTTPGP